MLHSAVIGNDHYQIHRLTAELQSPASAGNCDRGWSAPRAAFRAACSDALTVASSKSDCYLDHERNYRDAFCIPHDLVRDRLIWRGHDFVQNFGRRVQAFIDIRLVFIPIRTPRRPCEQQQTSAECEETFRRLTTRALHKITFFAVHKTSQ